VSPEQLSADLTARALAWQNLAAQLTQHAEVWDAEAARWEAARDPRSAVSGYRTQWVAEQARQLAAWLRLAADHLFSLAANEIP
jgi:hypothetical protein